MLVAVAGLEPATNDANDISSLYALPTELHGIKKSPHEHSHTGTFNLSIQYISFDFNLTA